MKSRFQLKAAVLGMLGAALILGDLSAIEENEKSPNVLWITTEDNCPYLGCYGDTRAVTPNHDKLASEGVMYTNAFSNSPVCAPARFTLFNGVTAQKMGTTNMRSGHPIPENFYPYVKYLNDAGYYCIHRDKGDYNYSSAISPYTYFHERINWGTGFWKSDKPVEDSIDGKRKKDQPFFCHINIGSCHESAQNRLRSFKPTKEELSSVKIPPFQMDNSETRLEWARFYQSMKDADVEVGRILKKLNEDGLAEDTVVFLFADNGGPLPRGKRYLHETGTRIPLIIRFPEKYAHLAPGRPGTKIDRMISFADFGPALLNLLGIAVPEHMEGKPFLGPNLPDEPEYVFLARDRVDSFYDLSRAVRSRNYRYLRNYMPAKLQWQRAVYPENCWRSMAKHYEDFLAGRCDEAQSLFWQSKPPEEFYDVAKDPWEVNNLIDDPALQEEIAKMREANRANLHNIKDPGFVPEGELSKRCSRTFTAYDLVRREDFPYELLVETAELSGEKKEAHLPLFIERLEHPEAAIRFWAAMGCAVLEKKAESAARALEKLLTDESLDARAAAAEALVRMGRLEKAVPVLIAGLENHGHHYHRFVSTLTDLDCRHPGIFEPYKELLKNVKLQHWRHIKTYNFLVSNYGLPQRNEAAARKSAEK